MSRLAAPGSSTPPCIRLHRFGCLGQIPVTNPAMFFRRVFWREMEPRRCNNPIHTVIFAMRTIPIFLCAALATGASLRGSDADIDLFGPPDPFVQGNAAFARGEVSAADSFITPLTQGKAPRAGACELLGEIRVAQKRLKEAADLFRQAAILSPKNASYQSRLGNALLQYLGEADESQRNPLAAEALAALKQSVELDPDNTDGYVGLANYYAGAPETAGGGYDKAIHVAEELEKRQPFDGALAAAEIAERCGRLEAALASYRKALQLYSGSPDLRACEPRVLAKLGRTAEARTCYEKILADYPGWEPARQALAALPAH